MSRRPKSHRNRASLSRYNQSFFIKGHNCCNFSRREVIRAERGCSEGTQFDSATTEKCLALCDLWRYAVLQIISEATCSSESTSVYYSLFQILVSGFKKKKSQIDTESSPETFSELKNHHSLEHSASSL